MFEAPSISPNAKKILERRYLKKDGRGKVIESPEEMFHRVAKNVASANSFYSDTRSGEEEEFYHAMRGLEFLPNSPTLMNAGTDIQQLSACFVIPVGDSIESIYDAVKYAAMIHQGGGGTGMSFSRLRPSGDIVRSTGGVASGPVSFMKVFDAATEAIKQGGRRRGANMGVLRVDHPDIEPFIASKQDLVSLSNFNISVAITDDFMEKASKNAEYPLINPRTGEITERKNAAMVLEDISLMAWSSGDPGVIFIDEINRQNPTPCLGRIEATNPCGEVPLLPFEACNLGSINLNSLMSEERSKFTLNWERLGELVDMGIRFLDNVIDVSRYPLPQTTEIVRGNRKLGLGIMGFADCLVKMSIRYGSAESYCLAEDIISFIRRRAEKTTTSIGEERGSFPNVDKSIFMPPRRNATVLSIAPTGTISMIAGCSSGIEPLYAVSYTKHVLEGEGLKEIHPHFVRLAEEQGFESEELEREMEHRSSIQDMGAIPREIRRAFVTAHDISPREQVIIQALFQKHVDNAVSKTINLREDASPSEVKNILLLAYEQKCKGITVYREGAKPGQVLATKKRSECPYCGRHLRAKEGALECEMCG